MRIMLAMHRIMDYGGIINFVEDLAHGLRELGHEPRLRMLSWKPYTPRGSERGNERSIFGMKFDQRNGWVWTPKQIISYDTRQAMYQWYNTAQKFDAIIWVVPVPSANANNRGNTVWPDLYNTTVPQVAVIHDGNLRDGYPWLSKVVDKLKACVGVHPCAYNSLAGFGSKRVMIFNPQRNIAERLNNTPFHKRPAGWMSLQTFKGWKRVPDLLRAVPHMGTYNKTLIGTGIDYHYLTSETKCKYPGVWTNALKNNMVHIPSVTNAQRERLATQHRVLIDPSWSKKYALMGSHFNRVVIDGIITGLIPVGTDRGMAPGLNGDIFEPGKNCIAYPWDVSPLEYAAIIDEAVNMPNRKAADMISAGRELLKRFDSRVVANHYVAVLKGASQISNEHFYTDIGQQQFTKYFGAV